MENSKVMNEYDLMTMLLMKLSKVLAMVHVVIAYGMARELYQDEYDEELNYYRLYMVVML